MLFLNFGESIEKEDIWSSIEICLANLGDDASTDLFSLKQYIELYDHLVEDEYEMELTDDLSGLEYELGNESRYISVYKEKFCSYYKHVFKNKFTGEISDYIDHDISESMKGITRDTCDRIAKTMAVIDVEKARQLRNYAMKMKQNV